MYETYEEHNARLTSKARYMVFFFKIGHRNLVLQNVGLEM